MKIEPANIMKKQNIKGRISEIFSSIQGEGLYRGMPQVFIRFSGCNLDCSYCDTPDGIAKNMSVPEVVNEVNKYKGTEWVSITGGEPLLQISFLKPLISILKEYKKKIYLETNGVLSENLKAVVENIDMIAMDFKLPSSTGQKGMWEKHEHFLECSLDTEVFGKVVINDNTSLYDVEKVLSILGRFNRNVPLVIQPQHPLEDRLEETAEDIRKFCQRKGFEVVVLRQLHKELGLR